MRKKTPFLRGSFFAVLLCAGLIFTSAMAFNSINNLQGEARVVNYTGIVRGATQKLVKEELNHVIDDPLIARLDSIIEGLSEGSEELDLIALDSREFHALLDQMKERWSELKLEIMNYREGGDGAELFRMSQDYFDLADQTVFAAEANAEKNVNDAKKLFTYTIIVLATFGLICIGITIYQDRRNRKLEADKEEQERKGEELLQSFNDMLVPINDIPEMIYVSDIETHELLFTNEIVKQSFELELDKPLKCYKVLQGFDEPCSFCNSHQLSDNENYTWEYTNPITHCHYLLKDRLIQWKGRTARMEMAFDITESVKEKVLLQSRIKRDNVLVDCIHELYRNHNVREALKFVVEQTCRLFDAQRSYIFLFKEGEKVDVIQWCENEKRYEGSGTFQLPDGMRRGLINYFQDNESMIVSDTGTFQQKLRINYNFEHASNLKSLVMVPIESDGIISGCMGINNADDELGKNAAQFFITLRYFVMISLKRKETEDALYKLSYSDTLTSFYNRNRFTQDMAALAKCEESIGVVYLDINGLKEINDYYGHDQGDFVLKDCAETIRKSFNSDGLYRLGGDEFVVICPGVSEEEFNTDIRSLKRNFAEAPYNAAIGTQWKDNSEDVQQMIKVADQYMYADKKDFYRGHTASGRYRFYNDKSRIFTNPTALSEKINNGQFMVYLQAKVDIYTGQVSGAEALIRYRDDSGNIVFPDKFIEDLESSCLIDKIDFYVFETICAKIKEWKAQGKKPVTISGNFSRSTFMEDSFSKKICNICDKYQVSKEYLQIEITEGMAGGNPDDLKEHIEKVRAAGFAVSVDDFGIECSNLALLAVTEVDVLKIDKAFVQSVTTNPNAYKIIKTVAELCDDMDISLVAEDVENDVQLEILKECGIKTVQGFLFSRPVSIPEFEEKYIK